MANTYIQLKDELSVLYPDVTDVELNQMVDDFIYFYTTAVKVILENS